MTRDPEQKRPARAPTLAKLRTATVAAQKRSRAAKAALKLAKKTAKDSKRDLKRARKALAAAEDSSPKLGRAKAKTPTAPSAKSREPKSPAPLRKKAEVPVAKRPEVGSKIANSPETQRAARRRKTRPSIATKTPATSDPSRVHTPEIQSDAPSAEPLTSEVTDSSTSEET